jgi:two-component system, response regulator / RNA-binding antiterminator
MNRPRIPNFRNRHALILHRPSNDTSRLARQLERLGMSVECCWPDFPAGGDYADVIFFDADNGYSGLFPWVSGNAPMPLVALFGSELPGRLEWALSQGISAHITKPIQSSGVFSALVVAFSNFEAERDRSFRVEDLKARLDNRPAVIRAVVAVMQKTTLNDDAAYACLRSAAMRNRVSVEDFCSALDERKIAKLVQDLPPFSQRSAGK